MKVEPIHPWRWRALTLWIAVFTAAVIFGLTDIQSSRLSSCKRTYSSYLEVFRPFFPKGDVITWPARQQKSWNKLTKNVNELKAACDKQIHEGFFR